MPLAHTSRTLPQGDRFDLYLHAVREQAQAETPLHDLLVCQSREVLTLGPYSRITEDTSKRRITWHSVGSNIENGMDQPQRAIALGSTHQRKPCSLRLRRPLHDDRHLTKLPACCRRED
jgi:hypothetical protein